MAATVITDDIINYYRNASGLDCSIIEDFIRIVDQSNGCLDSSGVQYATQKIIKINAVVHLIHLMQVGSFESMSSPTGESVKFRTGESSGLSSTVYGRLVLNLDKNNCIGAILENAGSERFLTSVGC